MAYYLLTQRFSLHWPLSSVIKTNRLEVTSTSPDVIDNDVKKNTSVGVKIKIKDLYKIQTNDRDASVMQKR